MRGMFCLLSVLALGGLLLAGGLAQAESIATFDSPPVDTYPGIAGGGWAGPWVETVGSGGPTTTAGVSSATPLVDSGNYLSYNYVSTGSGYTDQGTLCRDYTDGIDLEAEHTVSFKVRIDTPTAKFNTTSDQVIVCDLDTPRSSPGSSYTWALYSFGGTGALDNWQLRNGTAWYDTGIDSVAGGTTVLDVALTIHPGTNTYDAVLTQGEDSCTATGLAFRNAGPKGYFCAGIHTDKISGEPGAFGLDTVRIIPEPSTMVLLLSALAGLVLVRRK